MDTSSNSINYKKLLTTAAIFVAVVFMTIYIYNIFFSSSLENAYDKLHKKEIEIYETKIKSLHDSIISRDKAYDERQAIILQKDIELSQSLRKQHFLQKQLQDEKNKLKLSDDTTNVLYFRNYVRSTK